MFVAAKTVVQQGPSLAHVAKLVATVVLSLVAILQLPGSVRQMGSDLREWQRVYDLTRTFWGRLIIATVAFLVVAVINRGEARWAFLALVVLGWMFGVVVLVRQRRLSRAARSEDQAAVPDEKPAPRLVLCTRKVPDWRFWIVPSTVPGTPTTRLHVAVIEAVNESGKGLENVRARILKCEPWEPAIEPPYPLRWYLGEHQPMEEVLTSMPPGPGSYLAIPWGVGGQLRNPGPHVLTIQVWTGPLEATKRFQLAQWRNNEYPMVREAPDEFTSELDDPEVPLRPGSTGIVVERGATNNRFSGTTVTGADTGIIDAGTGTSWENTNVIAPRQQPNRGPTRKRPKGPNR